MVVVVDIRLNRYSKIYNENEFLRGVIVIQSKSELKHDGIILTMEGHVNLQLSSKTVGIFEAFYQSVKPIQLLSYQIEICKAGKLPPGKAEFPFEFPLRGRNNRTLYETYHGVFINVQYNLKADIKRSFIIGMSVTKSIEFIVEYGTNSNIPPSESVENSLIKKALSMTSPSRPSATFASTVASNNEFTKPAEMIRVDFEMVGEAGSKVGFFRAVGHLDSVTFAISKPFTGEIIIDKSEFPIKSIDIQLVRVETCGCAEGFSKDASEIQTIQIGEGNVCKGLPIPVFMVFPRLFSCPTLITTNFKIEFEINIVIIFTNDFFKSENFPIKITRF